MSFSLVSIHVLIVLRLTNTGLDKLTDYHVGGKCNVADKYFYNAKGDAIPTSYIEDASQECKGTTLDDDPIYHTVYFDANRRKHISYDTVVVNGTHHYILGSGHERNHDSSEITPWDSGNSVTWREALGRHTRDLIK